jgi:hypothetical protein
MTAIEDARAALADEGFFNREQMAIVRALIAEVERQREVNRRGNRIIAELDRTYEWEYGVEYEVSNTESVHTAAHSERQARKWVEQSPTDTGLRRRRKAGPWEEALL